MLIGVLSDTHGRADTTAHAVRLLQARGARHLIHCGDVGGAAILDHLAGIPSAFVWGNCDYDTHTLKRYAMALGIQCFDALGRITLEGTVISFLHGDDHRTMRRLLDAQDCDLLLHGHTHSRKVEDVGKIRVVNPGALHRATPKTVALIQTQTRDVEFIEVE